MRSLVRGGDSVSDFVSTKKTKQFYRSGQWTWTWQQLLKQFTMALIEPFQCGKRDVVAQLAHDSAFEQAAAHPHPPVQPPALNGDIGFGKSELPREYVGLHRVHQRAVEVEDKRLHSLAARARFSCALCSGPWRLGRSSGNSSARRS